MRLLLFAFALLAPQFSWAQLFGGGGFEDGSYVLSASRTVRQPGQLKLRGGSQLAVKGADGKTLKLRPEQVASFRIGSRKYVAASNFHVKGGLGGADIDQAFVEQLDSGQVMLLRYEYSVGSGGAMGGTDRSTYLLRGRYDASATAVQPGGYSSGGKAFREDVRPFLAARPDLQKLLDEKRINVENLPAAIHALNNNLPFTPPAALNLE